MYLQSIVIYEYRYFLGKNTRTMHIPQTGAEALTAVFRRLVSVACDAHRSGRVEPRFACTSLTKARPSPCVCSRARVCSVSGLVRGRPAAMPAAPTRTLFCTGFNGSLSSGSGMVPRLAGGGGSVGQDCATVAVST